MYSCVYIALTKFAIERFISPVTVLEVKTLSGGSTTAKLDDHWIKARICLAHWMLRISGGLRRRGLALAGSDVRLWFTAK